VNPVVFHPDAETELRAAIAYYESRRVGLGDEFRSEIEAAVRRIQQNPAAYPTYNVQGTRKCVVRRFPYTLFFTEFESTLWIAAVAHSRRRPGYWASRAPG
jgi:toxin ParE1/3/4